VPYALPKQAFKHERKLFEAMQGAGSARKLKDRQLAFTRSDAVNKVAADLSLRRLRHLAGSVEPTEKHHLHLAASA
jgi:hypothetical protein